MLQLFVDADACPVKEEAYRVAERHSMVVYVVTCQQMRDPGRPDVTMMCVPAGPDLADDWIAEHIQPNDICVSDDIPLAARCTRKGAVVVNARGRLLHDGNIGEALATRDLLEGLRSSGALSEGRGGGGPAPYTRRDRSRFLEQLEATVRSIQRKHTSAKI
ncbi:MAG: YaiI/YqxD family protein [Candidatus Sumerlaeaceae bacterium]